MSEEQIFATVGFSDENDAKLMYGVVSNLHSNKSDYLKIFPEVSEPETFVDLLVECNFFGQVLNIEWFGGSLLDKRSIVDNIKIFKPKYLAIEHHFDSGESRKYGYIDNKKSNYKNVMGLLANENDEVGFTLALMSQNTKGVNGYLDQGVDPNSSFFKDNILLHQDDIYKAPLIIALIDAGARVNIQCTALNEGKSPLHLAAENNRDDIVKALIKAGANVNLTSLTSGQPPIGSAFHSESKSDKIIKMLCEAGADVNIIDSEGYSPLLNLLRWYRWGEPLLTKMKLLIKYGSDIHYFEKHTGNAVWLAKEAGHDDCVEYLVKMGLVYIEPIPKEPVPLPLDNKIIDRIRFIEEHVIKSNQLARDSSVDCEYWSADKAWLNERKDLWVYVEKSIQSRTHGRLSSVSMKSLKNYYLYGEALPDGIGHGYDGMKPYFLVWLHPSNDETILNRLLDHPYFERTASSCISGYNVSVPDTPFGLEGPRCKFISSLILKKYVEACDDISESFRRKAYFVEQYSVYVPSFLYKRQISQYYKTPYLLDKFIEYIGDLASENMSLINDGPVRIYDKYSKPIESTLINRMFYCVDNFNIDKLPYHRVEQTVMFVKKFKELTKEEPLKSFKEYFSIK